MYFIKAYLNLTAFLLLPATFDAHAKIDDIVKTDNICHVEVETEYYYPGVWERYSETELICNYWKFLDLDDEYKEVLESQLNEDGDYEAGNDYGDYDSYDEMNKE